MAESWMVGGVRHPHLAEMGLLLPFRQRASAQVVEAEAQTAEQGHGQALGISKPSRLGRVHHFGQLPISICLLQWCLGSPGHLPHALCAELWPFRCVWPVVSICSLRWRFGWFGHLSCAQCTTFWPWRLATCLDPHTALAFWLACATPLTPTHCIWAGSTGHPPTSTSTCSMWAALCTSSGPQLRHTGHFG